MPSGVVGYHRPRLARTTSLSRMDLKHWALPSCTMCLLPHSQHMRTLSSPGRKKLPQLGRHRVPCGIRCTSCMLCAVTDTSCSSLGSSTTRTETAGSAYLASMQWTMMSNICLDTESPIIQSVLPRSNWKNNSGSKSWKAQPCGGWKRRVPNFVHVGTFVHLLYPRNASGSQKRKGFCSSLLIVKRPSLSSRLPIDGSTHSSWAVLLCLAEAGLSLIIQPEVFFNACCRCFMFCIAS
mmetsp:Transcript_14028/g.36022  ORF Transcript_14028/g.36022 Transcript_14028/m.36022 type:complete len:237 (+) Transcript_14028:511-1221(+)